MLTENTVIGKIEVLEDGRIQIREDTVMLRDGVEVARTYHRRAHDPTDTPLPDSEDYRVKAIASVIWTPEVIAEYRRRVAIALAKFPGRNQ